MRPEWVYPLSSPDSLSPLAIDAAHAVLRSGKYTMGADVAAFEQEFAEWVGTTHAVMVNSGSSANLLAVDAMIRPSRNDGPTWGKGGDVLVPAVSWSTTVWPLIQLGLTPVWVDVDPDTLALDWAQAESLITPRTVGAMLVHVMGLAADLDDAHDFCERHRLTLIEDCCEAFGAHWHRSHVGTFGTMGTFSFYFSHQLTAIEGGMIVTSDDAIADDLRSLRSHGWSRSRTDRADWEQDSGIDPRFLFVGSGYNVRPLEIQGAIARVQLRDADAMLEQRETAVCALADVIRRVPWIRLIGQDHLAIHCDRRARRHSWMNLPCLVTDDSLLSAEDLRHHLERAGIETRPFLAGNLMRHPAFAKYAGRPCPVADRIMRDGLLMGCHPHGDLSKAVDVLEQLAKVAA